MAKKANDYMAMLDTLRPRTSALKATFDDYKRWATTPDGTYWSGQFAGAAQDAAANDCKGTDNADDTIEDAASLMTATITYAVLPNLTGGQGLIERVLSHADKGVSIDQTYKMHYTPAEGESDDSIARNRAHVADTQRQIEEYVGKWEKADAELKTQADTAREKMLSRINPKAALVDGRKILHAAATPADPGTATAIDYKKEYPKTTDPASVDPGAGTLGDSVQHIKNPPTSPTAATAAADPNAPQYGPFAKDTIDRTKVGGLGESVTYLNRNDKPPEEHKPSAAERFKTNISEGIDKGVDKLAAPFTDLRDRLGLGDKGFWEANEDAGRREWESFKHQMTTPPGADIAEGIKHNIENPGQYFGEKLVDGGALMAGGPEGLLPRAGIEGSAAHLGSMHPDLPSPGALHDAPAPAAHTADPPASAAHTAGDHTPGPDGPGDHGHVEFAAPAEHPHTDFGSTYKERLDQTPVNNGHWVGERGESQWVSQNPEVNQFLHEAGVDGIHYENGRPDFGPVTKGEVQIEDMGLNRDKNFAKADRLMADEWGVTRQDVAQWRKDNHYSWHEEPDLKTMQLVPTIVNERLGHVGGIGEIKSELRKGGGGS